MKPFGRIQTALFSTVVFVAAQAAFAQIIPNRKASAFDPHELAECMVMDVLKVHTPERAQALLRQASKASKKLARIYLKDPICDAAAARVSNPFKNSPNYPLWDGVTDLLSCQIFGEMNRHLHFHSIPLAHHAAPALVERLETSTEIRFDTYLSWVADDNIRRPGGISNLNTLSNLKELIPFRELAEAEPRVTGPEVDQNVVSKTHRLAGPLIDWLLDQKPRTVSQLALFRKATEFYGDPLIGLAVIGEIFDKEQQACPSRTESCPLGNRMVSPLKNDIKDLVGYNYHFWAYLNIALVDDAVSATPFVYFGEYVIANDLADYSADKTALEVGHNMRRLLWDGTTSYRLRNKTCRAI